MRDSGLNGSSCDRLRWRDVLEGHPQVDVRALGLECRVNRWTLRSSRPWTQTSAVSALQPQQVSRLEASRVSSSRVGD